jgi:hypothetical protein
MSFALPVTSALLPLCPLWEILLFSSSNLHSPPLRPYPNLQPA